MPIRHIPIRISTYSLLIAFILFLVASALIVMLTNYSMKQQAVSQAKEKTNIIITRNRAIHKYFMEQLVPKMATFTGPLRNSDYYDPVWMSSIYAVREIDKYFRSLYPSEYYYKIASVEPRSLQNLADMYEKRFVEELVANPDLNMRSQVQLIDGSPYYVVLKRGPTFENKCLRCHNTPEEAPTDLLAIYGAERGFHRKLGLVSSGYSIRIPLKAAFAEANRFSFLFSAILLVIFGCIFGTYILIVNRFILSPLSMIREKASLISTDIDHLGDEIPIPKGRELQELTTSFNKMSAKLRKNRDQLEERVKERTVELDKTNEQLRREIDERTCAQADLEKVIDRLQDAQGEVKTLSGMLPICSACKKIRDDKGYWNQLESYIRDHSNVDFSHSICPECAKALYPNIHTKRRA